MFNVFHRFGAFNMRIVSWLIPETPGAPTKYPFASLRRIG